MPKGYRKDGTKLGFQKGNTPWCKGTKGTMKVNSGSFKKGIHAGSKNLNWKGGRPKTTEGYIFIHNPNHPFATQAGYVFEHRLVVEQQIGRYLTEEEVTHHLGETGDNRPHMLMAFINNSAHTRFHHNPDNVKPEEIIFDGRKLNKAGSIEVGVEEIKDTIVNNKITPELVEKHFPKGQCNERGNAIVLHAEMLIELARVTADYLKEKE